ncbi:MAG: hypothetical protein PHD10_02195 [Bacilli bacterium]|nr:hypothetical protein [Bacilli bacterium]MDD4607923.1 hypothetical protein [Bacilli bacterium]
MKKSSILIIIVVLLCGLVIFYVASKESERRNKVIDKKTLPLEQTSETDDNKQELTDVFSKTYDLALEMSSKIMVGTNWLENDSNCIKNETKKIDGVAYVKSCNEKYATYEQVTTYLNTIFTPNFTKTFLDSNGYKKVDDVLYYLPDNRTIDKTYKKFDSYKIIISNDNQISYLVKSAYGDKNCTKDCKDTFKEHYFSVEKIDNHWYVSEFEMPY